MKTSKTTNTHIKKNTANEKIQSAVSEWQWHRLHMLAFFCFIFFLFSISSTCTNSKQFQMFWHCFSCYSNDFLFRFLNCSVKFVGNLCDTSDLLVLHLSRSLLLSPLQTNTHTQLGRLFARWAHSMQYLCT